MDLYNPAISYDGVRRVAVGSVADIASVFSSGGDGGLNYSICNTGHGFHTRSESVSGVIDLSRLRAVETIGDDLVRVEAGARWSDVRAAIPRGRRVVSGSFPGVGVCGYLSGSGVGPDVRLMGPSALFLDSLEVVDRRGESIRCSRQENPDVFGEALLTKGTRYIISSATIRTIEDSLLRCVDVAMRDGEIGSRTIPDFIREWMIVSDGFSCVGSSLQVMFIGGVPTVKLRAVARKDAEGELRSFTEALGVSASIFDLWGSQLPALHAEPEKSPGSFMDGFGILSSASTGDRGRLVDELIGLGRGQNFFGVELRHCSLHESLLDATLSSALWRDVSFIVQHGSLAEDPVNANEVAYGVLDGDDRRELPNFSRGLERSGAMDDLIRGLR